MDQTNNIICFKFISINTIYTIIIIKSFEYQILLKSSIFGNIIPINNYIQHFTTLNKLIKK